MLTLPQEHVSIQTHFKWFTIGLGSVLPIVSDVLLYFANVISNTFCIQKKCYDGNGFRVWG